MTFLIVKAFGKDGLLLDSLVAVKKVRILSMPQLLNVTKEFDLARLLRGAFDYARSFFRPSGVEAEVKLDPHTGLPTGFGGKITFTQPDSKGAEDVVSVDELLRFADAALADQEVALWILLDRLDVAFAESPELEENALCALFRVYLDFLSLERIRTKIFLRSDIWRRITAGGFREASHITRSITISWNRGSFANLIARRLLKNQSICEYYLVSSQSVLSSISNSNLAPRYFVWVSLLQQPPV